jgi:hypothetical protein
LGAEYAEELILGQGVEFEAVPVRRHNFNGLEKGLVEELYLFTDID